MKKVCSFFGHREVLDNIEDKLYENIKIAIENYGVTEFYVGGYGEFDKLASVAINNMKQKYSNIKLYLCHAYLSQNSISEIYDGTIFFEGLETGLKRFAISKINKLMVKYSDVIIFYVKRKNGGAYTAVNFGKNKIRLSCLKDDIFN